MTASLSKHDIISGCRVEGKSRMIESASLLRSDTCIAYHSYNIGPLQARDVLNKNQCSSLPIHTMSSTYFPVGAMSLMLSCRHLWFTSAPKGDSIAR